MAERISKAEWKKRRKRKRMIRKYSILGAFALIVILLLVLLIKFISFLFNGNDGIIKKAGSHKIKEKLLEISETVRPGEELKSVKGIVIHATNKPGLSADELLKTYKDNTGSKDKFESVHFIVDSDGAIYQCIPTDEIAFHAMGRNSDTLGIMFCHTSADGQMTDSTRKALKDLIVKLCKEYKLKADNVILHYDINQKLCPAYYAENAESWQNFLKEVSDKL
ncbi:MAG: N-acetylmuramoyl-L-alanine amidase [Lachnospiraceae bacterium]|nr:N-acetylmuramoyl-L-alanine amidase [Lachnospiraceae bacterium]